MVTCGLLNLRILAITEGSLKTGFTEKAMGVFCDLNVTYLCFMNHFLKNTKYRCISDSQSETFAQNNRRRLFFIFYWFLRSFAKCFQCILKNNGTPHKLMMVVNPLIYYTAPYFVAFLIRKIRTRKCNHKVFKWWIHIM